MIDIAQATARDIVKAVRKGLHAEDVAEAFRDRIARIEPRVKAFAHLAQPTATTKGPLAGVPFGVKDVFDTFDMPTEYGSRAYAGWRPCRDASAVHLARQAGAAIMGKTVTTEFATAAPGATVNPFDPTRTPGGSSSGSAAALAAGMVLLAYGTQTSGSTIRPASFCGVVGMKPSPGLVDRTGIKPLSATLDVVGLMARCVRDAALLASVAMRQPMEEASTLPSIGLFCPETDGIPSPDSIAVLERVARILGGVSDVTAPRWWDGLAAAQSDVFAWEASAALATDRDRHWNVLADATHAFLHRHDGITHDFWARGILARDTALRDLDRLFGPHDLLLTQAAPGEAPVGLGTTGQAAYNIRWTLLGCPTLSLPAGFGPSGMPIGVQIVARPGADRALLAWSALIEDRLRSADIPARPEMGRK